MKATKRIASIDILRGIVMVIMALDHTRDYFHVTANVDDPLNLETTTYFLFFTRYITHYCAPVFVFLAGTSVYLQSRRKSASELGVFLLKRGIWLVFLEFTIIGFAWTFNPNFNIIPMQVIYAIGMSMMVLGILIWLGVPYKGLLVIGLVIFLGHNGLDYFEAQPGFNPGFWWDLLHSGVFNFYPITAHTSFIMVYPFPAWVGVMTLGYCFGVFFGPDYGQSNRKRLFTILGLGMILLFLVLRGANIYGDPQYWSAQSSFGMTILSFLNVTKYPPSLLYLLITLGPAIIVLAWIEPIQNRFTNVMIIYGRTALFYYILHIYVIHALTTISFFVRGHTFEEATKIGQFPFWFVVPGEGYDLWVVYLVTAVVVTGLYPLCKWYNEYKSNHREKWWLSYL